jgi:hypothetical protein
MDAADRPLRVSSDRRGFAGGAVLACAGPWRTSGAWWEDEGKLDVRTETVEMRRQGGERSLADAAPARETRTPAWNRDEWDVALADGAVYRIFRDRMTDGWFIDGVVD